MTTHSVPNRSRLASVKKFSVTIRLIGFVLVLGVTHCSVAGIQLEPVIVTADDLYHEFRDLGNSAAVQIVFLGDGTVGRATPSFEASLDGETQLSYTVAAPPGSEFVVTPGRPVLEEVQFLNTLRFAADGGELVDPVDAAVAISFAGLEGEPPSIFNKFPAVNADGNFIALGTIQTDFFSNQLVFQSMTFTLTFPPIKSSGPKVYRRVFGDLRARMLIQYSGSTDPGRFVTVRSASGPILSIRRTNGSVILEWPQDSTDYVLEFIPFPGSTGGWNLVNTPRIAVAENWTVTLDAVSLSTYFRLRGP